RGDRAHGGHQDRDCLVAAPLRAPGVLSASPATEAALMKRLANHPGAWQDERGKQLVADARRHEIDVPATAKARVLRQPLQRKRSARMRVGALLFASGAACAAAVMLLVLFFQHGRHDVPLARVGGRTVAVAPGESFPASATFEVVDLHGAGKMVLGPETLAKL